MANPISVRRRAIGTRPPLSLSRTLRNTVPAPGSFTPGAQLRLRERALEARVEAHHLARALHLRAEQRVDVGETGEREHGLLHGHVRSDGVVVQVEVCSDARPP